MKTKTKIAASASAAAIMGSIVVWQMLPTCEDVFIDFSHMSPTQPSTPNYKWSKTIMWRGSEYLVLSNGWSVELYQGSSLLSSSSRLVCPIGSTPCPGIVPGDYDWPLERFAICDDAEFMAVTGKDGVGGTIILRITEHRGRPKFSEKGIISHSLTRMGAYTWMEGDDQYMITDLPSTQCGSKFIRYPSVWRITSVFSAEFVRCLNYASFVPNGGVMVGEYLYLTAHNQNVHAYTWPGLSYRGVMPPQTLFSDGLGAEVNGDLLAISRTSTTQIWDANNSLAPVMLSELPGSVHAFFESDDLLIWTAPRSSAQPSAVWCLRDPTSPRLISTIETSKPNQLWQAGAQHQGGVLAAGQVVSRVDLGCFECQEIEIFDDGFEAGDTLAWSETK